MSSNCCSRFLQQAHLLNYSVLPVLLDYLYIFCTSGSLEFYGNKINSKSDQNSFYACKWLWWSRKEFPKITKFINLNSTLHSLFSKKYEPMTQPFPKSKPTSTCLWANLLLRETFAIQNLLSCSLRKAEFLFTARNVSVSPYSPGLTL